MTEATTNLDAQPRFDRLRRTSVLGGEAFSRWTNATVLVIGAGALGAIAKEAVRAGAKVIIADFDVTKEENLGTQAGRIDLPKALSMADDCDAILSGRSQGLVIDARHLGVGVFAGVDLIIDATDDPSLAVFLTLVSNGVGVPLMRVAVDGSGRHEFGRVLVSHGAQGHACQICSWEAKDLLRGVPRTPCPGRPSGPPPTLATNATAMTITGIGLLQAMRLVASNDPQALDREVLVDLDNLQILPQRLVRSEECLSGHRRWDLEFINRTAAEMTFGDAVKLVQQRLEATAEIEPFNHPLWTAAECLECRDVRQAVGSIWISPPPCRVCGSQTKWRLGSDRVRFSLEDAKQLEIENNSLAKLGLPESGAMLIGKAGRRRVRVVLQ